MSSLTQRILTAEDREDERYQRAVTRWQLQQRREDRDDDPHAAERYYEAQERALDRKYN